MRTTRLLAVLAATWCVFAATPLWANPIVLSFQPASQTITDWSPGSDRSVSVTAVLTGLPPGVLVGAFDLGITFDESVIAFDSSQSKFYDYLGTPNTDALTDVLPNPGSVDVAEVSLLDPTALEAVQGPLGGDLPLADLVFTLQGLGTSSLVFSDVNIVDAYGTTLVSSPQAGTTLDVLIEPGQVSVVPEPSTLLLVLLPALAMFGFRRYGGRARPTSLG